MASVRNRSDDHKYSHQEVQMLQQQINALVEENVRSYTANKIINISTNESPQIRTITTEKQDDIYNKLNPHVTRLKQYTGAVTHLNKKYTDYKELNQLKEDLLAFNETPKYPEEKSHSSIIYNEDDVKNSEISSSEELYIECVKTRGMYTEGHDGEYYEYDGSILLRQATNCSNLLTAEQARTDVIDEYIVPLNETTNELKQILKRYKTEVQTATKTFNEIDRSYQETKAKRISLQEWIQQLMTEFNEAIDAENEINKKRRQISNEFEVLKLETNEYEKLLKQSRSLPKAYETYRESVESSTNEISEYFGEQMELHERNWTKWTSEDVSNYIKFLNQTICENKIKLSNNINLNVVTEGIRNNGISGVKLDRIEKNDWFPVGVQWVEDRNIIHGKIQALVKKYPRKRQIENIIEIPAKYKCQISGKIMMNPVRCSDNKVYDKQTVLQYIDDHKKLPENDDEYDEDDIMTTMGALKREIAQFISQHPNCQ